MKNVIQAIGFVVFTIPVVIAAVPTGSQTFQHPLIDNHGGIVVLPDAEHQPKTNSKVVLDIVSDEKSGSVIKGLDRAALILNQYTQADAGAKNGFRLAIVLHGAATVAALSHDGYVKHAKPYLKDKKQLENPNLKLLKDLRAAGVEIFVCGQALAHHGFEISDVTPEVKVAVSAATVNINLQMDRYAYIPFH